MLEELLHNEGLCPDNTLDISELPQWKSATSDFLWKSLFFRKMAIMQKFHSTTTRYQRQKSLLIAAT